MSASGSAKPRFEREGYDCYRGMYAISGDTQVELGFTSNNSCDVIEAREVKDLIVLLQQAREASYRTMIDYHAQEFPDHAHKWVI
mgnify:FL=1